jgi:hypothetical protein
MVTMNILTLLPESRVEQKGEGREHRSQEISMKIKLWQESLEHGRDAQEIHQMMREKNWKVQKA